MFSSSSFPSHSPLSLSLCKNNVFKFQFPLQRRRDSEREREGGGWETQRERGGWVPTSLSLSLCPPPPPPPRPSLAHVQGEGECIPVCLVCSPAALGTRPAPGGNYVNYSNVKLKFSRGVSVRDLHQAEASQQQKQQRAAFIQCVANTSTPTFFIYKKK